MNRFWLALLLTLLLQPVPAAAEPAVPPVAERAELAADRGPEQGHARANGGVPLGLLGELIERRLPDRSARADGPARPGRRAPVLLAVRPAAPARPAAAPRSPVSRGEHLPYYATAPPSSR